MQSDCYFIWSPAFTSNPHGITQFPEPGAERHRALYDFRNTGIRINRSLPTQLQGKEFDKSAADKA